MKYAMLGAISTGAFWMFLVFLDHIELKETILETVNAKTNDLEWRIEQLERELAHVHASS
jgi:hypothetical protein